jgi:phage terminase large subunit GpA-like protein
MAGELVPLAEVRQEARQVATAVRQRLQVFSGRLTRCRSGPTSTAWSRRGTSPEPGPWRTSRACPTCASRWTRSATRRGARHLHVGEPVGKTDGLLLNAIGYFAAQDPAPILLVQPTRGRGQAFSKERVEPTFRESPALRGLLSSRPARQGQHHLLKTFPGGYLASAWATSSVSLASRPIRVLLGDELDRWAANDRRGRRPWVAGGAAHGQLPQPQDRRGLDADDRRASRRSRELYDDTDQRRLWVPCPRCGAFQVLEWARVRSTRAPAAMSISTRCTTAARTARAASRSASGRDAGRCAWRADNPRAPPPRLPALGALLALGEVARAAGGVGAPRWRTATSAAAGVREPAPRRGVVRGGRAGRRRRTSRRTAPPTEPPTCPMARSSSPPASTPRTTASRPRSSAGARAARAGASPT